MMVSWMVAVDVRSWISVRLLMAVVVNTSVSVERTVRSTVAVTVTVVGTLE